MPHQLAQVMQQPAGRAQQKLTHDGVIKLLPLLEVSSGPHGQNLKGLAPRPEFEVLLGSLCDVVYPLLVDPL